MPENEPEKETVFSSWSELAARSGFANLARTMAFSAKLDNGDIVNFIFEDEQLRQVNPSPNSRVVEVTLVPDGTRGYLKTEEIVSISYRKKGYSENLGFG